jgi:hypothetical protein
VSGTPEYAEIREEDKLREAWRAIHAGIAELEETIGVQGPASRVMREAEDIEAELWPDDEPRS